MYTPKQRMLNAYRGIFSDRYPIAPEFWYYYPARVLGVDMVQFEREIPLWKALQITFKKYGTEGWGPVFVPAVNPDVDISSSFNKIDMHRYRERIGAIFKNKKFVSTCIYDTEEPSWSEEYPVKDAEDLMLYMDMKLSDKIIYDFSPAIEAYCDIGEDYLLEFWLGMPFFDFVAEAMGFENAVMYFQYENEDVLKGYRRRLIEFNKKLIQQVCRQTPYESFVIGCSFSNNSLIGPHMWRRWDKPYIQAIVDEIHKHGKLLHIHFHGRCMETVADFAELGIDCVCPFERPPGGDVVGLEGLRKVRRLLNDKVTFNGNVHTVETLIRGSTEDVKREVKEIKSAFAGSARLIIGTGDQVGRETPEENIFAMIEEAK